MEGNLCKGIVAFLVVGLKLSIPFVVQTIPEVTFNGQWVAETFRDKLTAEVCTDIPQKKLYRAYCTYRWSKH